MGKTLVFDSSTLISLSETCSTAALGFLKKRSGVRLAAPQAVYEESVGTPSRTHKFGFSALRIKRLFSNGVIEVPAGDLRQETDAILQECNSLLAVGGRPLKLIHEGEAACIALLQKTGAQHLAIDEKTLRLMVESPKKMRKLLQAEYSQPIEENTAALKQWEAKTKGVRIIRSAEILATAAQEGFFRQFGADEQDAWHAAAYALRNAGCSLSSRELAAFAQIRA
ncbi:MAG: hypothetical protein V1708_01780 [Candidatus Micrarchaeota archaeon]